MTRSEPAKSRVALYFFVFLMQSCSTRWTEKEKREFALKCSQSDTADNLVFTATGFGYNEIESIGVRRIHGGRAVDSFSVHPDKRAFDSLRRRYTFDIDRTLHTKDSYEFIVPGQKPFVLSAMKMVVAPQYSMFSEGYGCIMSDYEINGLRFEEKPNPDFSKEGLELSRD